jgi:RimJ/RimL family protein N-acetyltransferase
MFIQGRRVIVRKLRRTDLLEMTKWRPFDDPLLDEANWPQRSLSELNLWYSRFDKDPRRMLCAVTDQSGRIIGSITLRERVGRRSARLGITFGADFVDQGFGSEALALFLDYYFGELRYEKLVLDVAGHNQRAIRVYKKLGFVTIGEHERSMGRSASWSFLDDSEHADLRRFFRRDWMGRRWLICYDMELRREDWEKRRKRRDREGRIQDLTSFPTEG